MTAQSTRGILLGRQPFGNTALILRWLSPDCGRITTLAKGALKSNNSYGLNFDLYYLCDLQFIPARRGDMHALREVRLIEPHLGLRREWVILLALEYFAALVETLTETGTALPDDFALFLKAAGYLDRHAVTRQVVERFESRLLSLHGLATEGEVHFLGALQRYPFPIPPQRTRLLQELIK